MSATHRETHESRFGVEVEPARDMVRVRPSGELDLSTVDRVRERVEELTRDGFARVLLDLRELTFLDSSGIRLVLDLERSSQAERWELGVVDGSPEIGRVFDITGVRSLVPFVGETEGRWRA